MNMFVNLYDDVILLSLIIKKTTFQSIIVSLTGSDCQSHNMSNRGCSLAQL